MQINPKDIVSRGIVKATPDTRIQQVGIDCTLDSDVWIEPGHCANVAFQEEFNLPEDVFAICYIRSTLARKGMLASITIWDPGFHGKGGIVLHNFTGTSIQLEKGDRVAQIVCYDAQAASTYNGQYNNDDIASKDIKAN